MRSPKEVPEDAFAFKLFGRTLVVYENPARRDTYGRRAVRPRALALAYRDGRRAEVAGGVAPEEHALAVRASEVKRIDVMLA